MHVCMLSGFSCVRLCAILWTAAHEAPLSTGKNIGVGCHFLLQEIFLTQGLNLGLLHCRQILYHWRLPGKPARLRGYYSSHCYVKLDLEYILIYSSFN